MEKKAVQVQMYDSTLKKIDEMKTLLHTENRSEIVKTAVDVAEIIAREIKSGAKVTVVKDGISKELIIPGAS